MDQVHERQWGWVCLAATFVASLTCGEVSFAQTDAQVALPMGNSFYADNLTYTDSSVYVWPTDTPAHQGLNAATLAGANSVLGGNSKSASLLVVRGGKLVHESYFHNALPSHAKNIHSASKSILSSLIGIAIDDGLLTLDTKIGDVLPQNMSAARRHVTVRNLLTMTSGIAWSEDETEYDLEGNNSNFVQQILNLPQAHTPGTFFNYSTGDAYLLGAVLAEASDESLHQFAKQRLFDPLGIDVERWGRDNQGYFTGGFNFFITPREMAAFGQMILDDGYAHGHQIVPPAWIAVATTTQGVADDYGFMWWNDVNLSGHRGFRAWGWGKQFIYVFPDLDMVVTITHNTTGSVQDTDLNNFVRDHVIAAVTGPAAKLDGDFNHDHFVNALDYAVWRNGLGPVYDADDFTRWKQNYGATDLAGTGGLASLTIPEPTAAALLALGGVTTSWLRIRSARPRAAYSAPAP